MNKQEKLKKIYDKIADKTLSFGCKIQSYYSWYQDSICLNEDNENIFVLFYNWETWIINKSDIEELKCRIIWHPVMFWDVYQYLENNIKEIKNNLQPNNIDLYVYLSYVWKNKKEPIEKQSNECINYIYIILNPTNNYVIKNTNA